jgi:hypothetical protein
MLRSELHNHFRMFFSTTPYAALNFPPGLRTIRPILLLKEFGAHVQGSIATDVPETGR